MLRSSRGGTAVKKTVSRKERMKKITTTIPAKLHEQMRRLVDDGWFGSEKAIIDDALRRFLYSHRPELLEKYIMEDVEWGLRGGK